ncbi:MAG: hypothetical protein IJY58_03590 [Alphaproteobacteria bacterium]|nr:hypothetical protein [Alphaproteobacteria bacterium]
MKKIIVHYDLETKTCDVADVTPQNTLLFPDKPIVECGQDWRGWWYKESEIPSKPVTVLEEEVRKKRDNYLKKYVDCIQLVLRWETLTSSEREQYRLYRQYLLDIPQQAQFPQITVLTFDEWCQHPSI